MTQTQTKKTARALLDAAKQWDLEAEMALVRASKLRIEAYLVDPPCAEGVEVDVDDWSDEIADALGNHERVDPFTPLFFSSDANVDALAYQHEVLGDHGVRTGWHSEAETSASVLKRARALDGLMNAARRSAERLSRLADVLDAVDEALARRAATSASTPSPAPRTPRSPS